MAKNIIIENNVKIKACSKCGKCFPLTSEYWHRDGDRFRSECKGCGCKKSLEYRTKNKRKVAKARAQHYAKNKEKVSKRNAEYRKNNKESIAKCQSEYYEKNKEKIKGSRSIYRQSNHKKIIASMARYRAENREKINKQKREHYAKNRDRLLKEKAEYNLKTKEIRAERDAEYHKKNKQKRNKMSSKYRALPAKHETHVSKLLGIEKIRESKAVIGALEAKCAYCGQWFVPTNGQIQSRIYGINKTGGYRLYCSDGCKRSCPTYGQVKFPKGFKKASSRESNPLLRKLVLLRDDYTCQKCGVAIGDGVQLHCHHVVPATQNPMTANDPDCCITLCKACHKEVHKALGCGYHELTCDQNAAYNEALEELSK